MSPAVQPSSGSGSQVPRLLGLLPYLISHPGATMTEVAAEFGVSRKTLEADLTLLFVECALPGGGPGECIDVTYEGEAITVADAQNLDRPMRLTQDEAVALLVASRALGDLASPRERELVAEVVELLEAATGASSAQQPVAVVMEAPGDALQAARTAVEQGRALRLQHVSAARDVVSERVVDPIAIRVREGRPYLQAWCRSAQAHRTFRLDRVLAAEVLDEPAQVPSAPDDLPAGAFAAPPEAPSLVLEVGPRQRWLLDAVQVEHVEPLADGRSRVSLRYADPRWALNLVLRLGAEATVVSPLALRAEAAAEAVRALGAYPSL